MRPIGSAGIYGAAVASIALSVLVLLLAASPARAGSWRRPVDGEVLRAFSVGVNPYARGQHRGVDLGAAPGSRVRSACTGRVSFAGRVPRGGRTVSVRCGRLIATYQQLGRVTVHAGRHVVTGAMLGTVGRSRDGYEPRPHVHLGARDAATHHYVDPLTLLRGAPLAPPVLPAARARPPGRPRAPTVRLRPPAKPRASAARRVLVRVPRAHLGPAAVPAAGRPVPWYTWLGLLSVGAALPIQGLVRLRRRRRAATVAAPAAT